MSNFEIEYKKSALESTPDLWARIEAGVDAYEEATKVEEEKYEEKITENEENNIENIGDYKKKKFNFRKYAGIIAVAACLLIVAPAIMFISNNSFAGANFTAEVTAEAPMVMEEATAEAPMVMEEAAAEAPMEAVADEAPMEEAAEAPMEETVAEEADLEIATNDEAPAQTMAKAVRAEETIEEEATIEEAAVKDSNCALRAMLDDQIDASADEIYVLDSNTPQTRVRLFVDRDITDFRIMKITVNGYSDDEGVIYTSEELYDVDELKEGDELVLEMSFAGDIPQYAVSFIDSDGNECVLLISKSGKDGSIVLSEPQ